MAWEDEYWEQRNPNFVASSRKNEPLLHRFGDGAATAVHLQLLIHAADVFVGGVKADAELGGGFLDGVALDEQLRDVVFARRESVVARRRMRLGEHLQHPARDARIDRRTSGGGDAEGVGDLIGGRGF